MQRYCTCGYPIDVKIVPTGEGRLPVFYDSAGYRQRVTRCPKCREELDLAYLDTEPWSGTENLLEQPNRQTERQPEKKEKATMPRGIPTTKVIDPAIGRRAIFSMAIRHNLVRADLERIADQLDQISSLMSRWHALEGEVMIELLKERNGATLTDLATQASEEAWQQVSAQFTAQFPGYLAKLEKGQVVVREE